MTSVIVWTYRMESSIVPSLAAWENGIAGHLDKHGAEDPGIDDTQYAEFPDVYDMYDMSALGGEVPDIDVQLHCAESMPDDVQSMQIYDHELSMGDDDAAACGQPGHGGLRTPHRNRRNGRAQTDFDRLQLQSPGSSLRGSDMLPEFSSPPRRVPGNSPVQSSSPNLGAAAGWPGDGSSFAPCPSGLLYEMNEAKRLALADMPSDEESSQEDFINSLTIAASDMVGSQHSATSSGTSSEPRTIGDDHRVPTMGMEFDAGSDESGSDSESYSWRRRQLNSCVRHGEHVVPNFLEE
jgi:hypothetical protein